MSRTLARSLLLPALAAGALAANPWLSTGIRKLGLLPFLLEHAMLPGEQRDIFVFDDSLRACATTAAATHRHIGGLHMTEDGGYYEIASLLRIDDVKELDQSCTWFRLSCMSRCLLKSVRRNKEHSYRVAVVSPCCDAKEDTSLIDSLRTVHSEVAAQRRQLRQEMMAANMFDGASWEFLSREAQGKAAPGRQPVNNSIPHIFVGEDKARAPYGVYDSYEAFEETGVLCEHVYVGQAWERPGALGCCYFQARDLGELDDEENGKTLDELSARRRTVLTAADPESGLFDAISDLWEVNSEEEAQTQLLSFAAAATLGPTERAQALMLTETSERLAFAREGLHAQRDLLATLLDMPTLQSERRLD
jgi:hypothetical protein